MMVRVNEAKDKSLENKKMKNLMLCVVPMEIQYKISLQQFHPPSEAEIHGLLHPAETNPGYFFAWFQSPQQLESPLTPKCRVCVQSNASRVLHFPRFDPDYRVCVVARSGAVSVWQ
jgi:hypothetical protein